MDDRSTFMKVNEVNAGNKISVPYVGYSYLHQRGKKEANGKSEPQNKTDNDISQVDPDVGTGLDSIDKNPKICELQPPFIKEIEE